jgi:hypothetical protein
VIKRLFQRKCDCEKRIAALEKRVIELQGEKQDRVMTFGLRDEYRGGIMSLHYSDSSRYYKQMTIGGVIDALLKHCNLDVVVEPGRPEETKVQKRK